MVVRFDMQLRSANHQRRYRPSTYADHQGPSELTKSKEQFLTARRNRNMVDVEGGSNVDVLWGSLAVSND